MYVKFEALLPSSVLQYIKRNKYSENGANKGETVCFFVGGKVLFSQSYNTRFYIDGLRGEPMIGSDQLLLVIASSNKRGGNMKLSFSVSSINFDFSICKCLQT